MTVNWLVCGSRGKFSKDFVAEKLTSQLWGKRALHTREWKPDSIIEGCCPNSADAYAEEWAKENGIEVQHFPAKPGEYLKRNIAMCLKASLVIAFWDGYSLGTAHTIAQAALRHIPTIIYHTSEVKRDEKSKV